MKQGVTRFTVRFTALLVAALFGQFVMRGLVRFPFSLRSYWMPAIFWAVAGCCYLLPRYFTQSVRGRVLGSLILLGVLMLARFLVVLHIRCPCSALVVLGPIPGLAVFCVFGALVPLPRKAAAIVALLCSVFMMYFVSLWWSYGFRAGLSIHLAAAQVIPFIAVVTALLVTDNLLRG